MDKTLIVRSLDIEIERLQRARALLSSTGSGSSGSGRGRRRGGPRHMSAAARKRISDAQKKRWAKVKSGQKKK
jgi:hypothetical protein